MFICHRSFRYSNVKIIYFFYDQLFLYIRILPAKPTIFVFLNSIQLVTYFKYPSFKRLSILLNTSLSLLSALKSHESVMSSISLLELKICNGTKLFKILLQILLQSPALKSSYVNCVTITFILALLQILLFLFLSFEKQSCYF